MINTDYDKLKALLKSFGVGYDELYDVETLIIICDEGSNKVSGYNCFYTKFVFDKEGEFRYMGAYE
jgi:hypothetical protein